MRDEDDDDTHTITVFLVVLILVANFSKVGKDMSMMMACS
jgi:hypothetical protein